MKTSSKSFIFKTNLNKPIFSHSSFKTKGNLTKHMKSKAHYKKCTELGLNPIPTSLPDDDGCEFDDSASMTSERTSQHRRNSSASMSRDNERDSDTDDGDESDDMDTDSDGKKIAPKILINFLNFFCFSLADTDESKSRLPEHEAAHCLLSLSMTPTHPSVVQQPAAQQSQSQQYFAQQNSPSWGSQDVSEPVRRLIFSNAKGEFDLLNHEQYYSDPNLNKMKSKPIVVKKVEKEEEIEESDELMPMDLTKKPRGDYPMVNVTNFIGPISEPAVLLNTLVSITEKIPSQSNFMNLNFTDSAQYVDGILPHEYITECAMKESKMKQSQQMSKVTEYHNMVASTAGQSPILPEKFQVYVKPVQEEEQKPAIAQKLQPVSQHSLMDTLADLASKSDKLEVNQSLLKGSGESGSDKRNQTDNAKSVASEYLKLTKKSKNKVNEENENSSDQEGSTSEPSASEMGINNMVVVQTVVVGEDGFRKKQGSGSSLPSNDALMYSHMQDDGGRPICSVCQKTFQKISHLRIHMNIHYMERKYRCEPCAVSFRTQGHLLKHERSVSHQNKVSMTSTFGVPTVTNPRPFKCKDCKIAFRIHGHLAKHLRSKMHVLKLECLQKLPFGTYAEMERSGFNFTGIDTSDCDSSLMSLRELARKLNEKDPGKIGPLPPLYSDDTDADAELNDLVNGINDNYDSDSSDAGMLGPGLLGQKPEPENLPAGDANQMENSTNECQKFDDGSADGNEGKLKRNFDQLDTDNKSSDKFVRNGDNSTNNSTNKKIKVTTTILTSSSVAGGSDTIVTTTSSMAGFVGNKNQ